MQDRYEHTTSLDLRTVLSLQPQIILYARSRSLTSHSITSPSPISLTSHHPSPHLLALPTPAIIHRTPHSLPPASSSLDLHAHRARHLLPIHPLRNHIPSLLRIQFPASMLAVPVFAQPAHQLHRHHAGRHVLQAFFVRGDPALEDVEVGDAAPCVVPVWAGDGGGDAPCICMRVRFLPDVCGGVGGGVRAPCQRFEPLAALEVEPLQRVCVCAEAAQDVCGFVPVVVEVGVEGCAAEGDAGVVGDHGRGGCVGGEARAGPVGEGEVGDFVEVGRELEEVGPGCPWPGVGEREAAEVGEVGCCELGGEDGGGGGALVGFFFP